MRSVKKLKFPKASNSPSLAPSSSPLLPSDDVDDWASESSPLGKHWPSYWTNWCWILDSPPPKTCDPPKQWLWTSCLGSSRRYLQLWNESRGRSLELVQLGRKIKKTHDYIWYLYPVGFSFRLIQFARLSPHFYLSNIVCLKHHVVKTSYLHLHLNLQNSENIQFCVNFLKTSQWLPHDLSLDGYIIVNNKNPVILKIMSSLPFSNINISKKQQS